MTWWFDRVPEGWETWKVSHFARIGNGSTPSRENAEYWGSGSASPKSIPWLNSSVVNREEVTTSEQFITHMALEECHLPMVQPGSVLVGLTGQGKTRAQAAVLSFEATISQHLAFIAPDPKRMDPWYLRYVLVAAYDFLRIISDGMGGTKGALTCENLNEMHVPVPPLAEQRATVAYIKKEVARLDRLVEAKERFLKLQSEKRRALLTSAVVRGLDRSATMRDSGVLWIGEAPAHWKVLRLKLVADVRGGLALGKDYASWELIKYPYLRVANVQDGHLDLSDVATVEIPEKDAAACMLQPGDVLMNEGGDADKLGRGCIWRGEISPCLHQNHVFAVRPRGVLSGWLDAWTSSEGAKSYLESRAKQSTNLASISATNIKELPILVPPEAEQRAIVEHVNREVAKLDNLTRVARRTMDLLRERRTALIAAAVMGQVDMGASA